MSREQMQQRIRQSRSWAAMKRLQKVLDDYYIDAMAGLLPWGIGDIATALFALVYIWFAATKVRSLAITLAVVNNSLRDIALGL
ncbi:MAG: DUF4112 domain-containing protein, partial [Prevotella sp.]|nr:DUF4112 domain-containing protein [Prevotella sp.]